MATPLMGLDLPTPTVTLGPAWATQLNAALEVVDAHDHSTGKGTKVPTGGLNINADLDFNTFGLLQVGHLRFSDIVTPLTGSTNTEKLHAYVDLPLLTLTMKSWSGCNPPLRKLRKRLVI